MSTDLVWRQCTVYVRQRLWRSRVHRQGCLRQWQTLGWRHWLTCTPTPGWTSPRCPLIHDPGVSGKYLNQEINWFNYFSLKCLLSKDLFCKKYVQWCLRKKNRSVNWPWAPCLISWLPHFRHLPWPPLSEDWSKRHLHPPHSRHRGFSLPSDSHQPHTRSAGNKVL